KLLKLGLQFTGSKLTAAAIHGPRPKIRHPPNSLLKRSIAWYSQPVMKPTSCGNTTSPRLQSIAKQSGFSRGCWKPAEGPSCSNNPISHFTLRMAK
ncbi:MAG: hypothetical protein ACKVII_24675, partial [Planctomycetales bacterium]